MHSNRKVSIFVPVLFVTHHILWEPAAEWEHASKASAESENAGVYRYIQADPPLSGGGSYGFSLFSFMVEGGDDMGQLVQQLLHGTVQSDLL